MDAAEGVQEPCRTSSTLSLETPANTVQRVRQVNGRDSEANARQPRDNSNVVDRFSQHSHVSSLEVRVVAFVLIPKNEFHFSRKWERCELCCRNRTP